MVTQEEVNGVSGLVIFLGLYGIYAAWSAIMILWKKKQILDPAKYLQFFLMNLTGRHDAALEYEKRLKAEINWPRQGKLVLAYGIVLVLGAIYVWILDL
jgi:hypothetical protein